MDAPLSELRHDGQIETLFDMSLWIEQDTSNYEIVHSESLFDEEFDEILLALKFNRGTETHTIVINSEGFVRATNMPLDLFIDIHNSIVTFLSFYPVINAE